MAEQEPARMRPSHAERAPYINAIGQALAEGRLTPAEHSERVGAAEAATSFAVLDELVSDIPFAWHDEQMEKAQRIARRKLLLGGAGVLVLGGLSWFGTRTWMDSRAEVDVSAQAGPTSAPEDEQTDSAASVATELVEVANWRADTLPIAIDYAESVGVVWVSDINGGGDFFTLEGADKEKNPKRIDFRLGSRPTVDDYVTQLEESELIKGARLRELDAQELLAKSRKVADLGDEEEVNLRIRFWPSMFTIDVSGNDHNVYWRVDGKRRWDEESEWDATS